MIPELLFGLRDGKAVHISEVESGLACACVCPKCGRRLVAKKGDIRVYHFAHEDDSDCQGAVESSLHLAAKEILEREKKIRVPLPGFFPAKLAESVNTMLEFDGVRLEEHIGGIIPDLIVFTKNRSLIIEINVTHAVDDAKLQKIKELGVSAIELDLSWGQYSAAGDTLKYYVIESTANKHWLYNAEEASYRLKMKRAAVEAEGEAIRIAQAELEKKREGRKGKGALKAWCVRTSWYTSYHVWYCPLVKGQAKCNHCDHFQGYQQNNHDGDHYRQNPDYVYCAKVK